MSNRSYLLRLIIPFAIMIVLVVTLSGWLIYHSGQEQARKRQTDLLIADAELTAQQMRDNGSRLTPELIERVDAEAKFRNLRLSIIDRDGTVVLDTHVKLKDLDNHNNRPEVIQARTTGGGQSVRDSMSVKTNYVYVARLVDQASGFVVRASRPEQVPIEVSTTIIVQLAGATAISVLIMSWLAYTLHSRWVAPVRRLAIAAERMAAGEWETRVQPAGVVELREFSTRMNFLAEQAQKHVDDLTHQRTDLESLVDSLPDPILLTDPQQRVILLNQPAARFLSVTTKQATGAKLISVLGDPSLVDVYEYVTSDQVKPGTPVVREFRVLRNTQKQTYQAVATRTPSGGVLLVLRDITRIVSTVQMKTDFVANASHELRTPIAAIKLAFETLSDVYTDDPQQTARCINIIAGHLQRLEDMLQDLLDLSRVENAEIKPEIQSLKAAEVIAVVEQTQGPIAQQKQISLEVQSDEGLIIQSDPRLLQLVLKNLVENGIKYTPSGGRVTVRMSGRENGFELVVSDTGIGIPPQHLERVFERFYQVDSARASSAGRGTGLGLAIVKHALHALGGQVKLDSTVGRGTVVTCLLPSQFSSMPTALEPAAAPR